MTDEMRAVRVLTEIRFQSQADGRPALDSKGRPILLAGFVALKVPKDFVLNEYIEWEKVDWGELKVV